VFIWKRAKIFFRKYKPHFVKYKKKEHLKILIATYHIYSALVFTDFQLALALFFIALAFLQPKPFWDIWDFSGSLSSCVALSFQWVPDLAELPSNKLADSLSETWTTLISSAEVPSLLAQFTAKSSYYTWIRNHSLTNLFRQIPYWYLRKNWPFSYSSAVNYPDFAASVTAVA